MNTVLESILRQFGQKSVDAEIPITHNISEHLDDLGHICGTSGLFVGFAHIRNRGSRFTDTDPTFDVLAPTFRQDSLPGCHDQRVQMGLSRAFGHRYDQQTVVGAVELDQAASFDAVEAREHPVQDDEIGRDFDRAENYLSMVGLIIVILGGIAVSSVTRVFVQQKLKS